MTFQARSLASRGIMATAAAAAVFVAPASASTQVTQPPPPSMVVRGEVLDANTGFPVVGAFVELVSEQRKEIADSVGQFDFRGVTEGEHQVRVSQLGYITLSEFTELLPNEMLTVWLTPKPLELEGITVTVNRLERRRRAFARAVRVLDQRDVLMSAAFDGRELLERIPGARTIPCGLNDCVLSRGRYRPVRVVIDEVQAYGGPSQLIGFPTSEIHSIEYVPSCATVRVYTNYFIERTARRGGRSFFSHLCSMY